MDLWYGICWHDPGYADIDEAYGKVTRQQYGRINQ
jgi:hypothetical protein